MLARILFVLSALGTAALCSVPILTQKYADFPSWSEFTSHSIQTGLVSFGLGVTYFMGLKLPVVRWYKSTAVSVTIGLTFAILFQSVCAVVVLNDLVNSTDDSNQIMRFVYRICCILLAALQATLHANLIGTSLPHWVGRLNYAMDGERRKKIILVVLWCVTVVDIYSAVFAFNDAYDPDLLHEIASVIDGWDIFSVILSTGLLWFKVTCLVVDWDSLRLISMTSIMIKESGREETDSLFLSSMEESSPIRMGGINSDHDTSDEEENPRKTHFFWPCDLKLLFIINAFMLILCIAVFQKKITFLEANDFGYIYCVAVAAEVLGVLPLFWVFRFRTGSLRGSQSVISVLDFHHLIVVPFFIAQEVLIALFVVKDILSFRPIFLWFLISNFFLFLADLAQTFLCLFHVPRVHHSTKAWQLKVTLLALLWANCVMLIVQIFDEAYVLGDENEPFDPFLRAISPLAIDYRAEMIFLLAYTYFKPRAHDPEPKSILIE